MARKSDLRIQRLETVINWRSKVQEKTLMRAVANTTKKIKEEFPFTTLNFEKEWYLRAIIEKLRNNFPSVDFHYFFNTSSMRPDGGILSLVDINDNLFPILISEKKNQGTNDLRASEGKKKQARGNAIERLGKNVIGFRTAMKTEHIFPFVCFGDGCDFDRSSSILDRVATIAQFGTLNEEHLYNKGLNGEFDRGSFYFKVPEWKEDEMTDILYSIAKKSIYYYFCKYGENSFKTI